jgi:histidyl-tRNA synthetase
MTEIVKGFKDTEDASKRVAVRNIIEETFRLYNYIPIETPIIETEAFVKGNNSDDEAVSSIFKLQDRGKRKLALRYEFTFQLKRLAKNKKLPYKRYQIGEVFRDEPIGPNRWRQFTQCDVDVVGSTIKDEAEILKITSEILNKLNIDFVINFNNRKLLNEILDDCNINDKDRKEIIREIDKLDKLSESEVKKNLSRFNAEKVLAIFKKPEKYFEKYESYSEVKELKKYCKMLGIKVNFQPFLARGLSYYNGSIFEIKTKKIKQTITAGGSYLNNGIQSSGISFGLDRLELLANIGDYNNKCLVVSLDQDKKAMEIAGKIRRFIGCSVFYGKPGKALDYANSYGIGKVIFIGDEEVKKNKFKVKDMDSGKEKFISEKNLDSEFKEY